MFDPSITRTSPAGSCLLKALQPIAGKWPMHLFIQETDLPPDTPLVKRTKIRLPPKPVFARAILFTLFSTCAYVFSRRTGSSLKISTEGEFPFCDLCYAHFCHRYFLSRHRDAIGGRWLRRTARIFTHAWGAFTERIAFRSARTIVVPSQGLARELESVYPAIVAGKIRLIANPVDTERFARPADFSTAPLREELHIPHDAFVLSFCALGNFERKGLRLVLEALARLHDTAVHLIIVGGTESEIREFATFAEGLALSGRVHFVGLQSDVRPYLWCSDAFVFPSVYEGFALVCLQAAAAGLPLIVTAVNGIEEFMDNGTNGWIVERTRASVEAAIRDAVLSPSRAIGMGRAAQERVQEYRQEIFQARWLELLSTEAGS